jgi:hypothetical protein
VPQHFHFSPSYFRHRSAAVGARGPELSMAWAMSRDGCRAARVKRPVSTNTRNASQARFAGPQIVARGSCRRVPLGRPRGRSWRPGRGADGTGDETPSGEPRGSGGAHADTILPSCRTLQSTSHADIGESSARFEPATTTGRREQIASSSDVYQRISNPMSCFR